MTIVGTTRKVGSDGKVSGTIKVRDGRRIYRVKYEAKGDHAEQWGASAEVLVFTFPAFESLITPKD